MNKIVVTVSNLTKSFKNKKVLKGVNFEIEKGHIFALLGSNGAGKTTTINILSTLLGPDDGDVIVNSYSLVRQPEQIRKSISLTGQFAAVDDILTGKENLELIAKLRHVPDPSKVANELLKQFGLEEASDQRAGTYSGGMARRLDIAMSLIGSPAVVILDEPTTGLDPEARIEVWKTIRNLARNGTTILLTTQYLEEAEQLADRIAILHEGFIIANGTFNNLKKLLPPVKKEYIERQPTLEEVFLAITNKKGAK